MLYAIGKETHSAENTNHGQEEILTDQNPLAQNVSILPNTFLLVQHSKVGKWVAQSTKDKPGGSQGISHEKHEVPTN